MFPMKKPLGGAFLDLLRLISGGEGGIRTRGGLLTLTRFPGVRLKPLIHLSAKPVIVAARLRASAASSHPRTARLLRIREHGQQQVDVRGLDHVEVETGLGRARPAFRLAVARQRDQ